MHVFVVCVCLQRCGRLVEFRYGKDSGVTAYMSFQFSSTCLQRCDRYSLLTETLDFNALRAVLLITLPCLIIQIAGMADRRKQQNYTALPSYCTESQWATFESSSREKSTGVLLNHAWHLGMRCPSEHMFGVMQNFLELVREVPGKRSQTSFERYEQLGSLKKDWKKVKTAMKALDYQYTTYLEQLPVDPRDLEPEYWLACFSHEVPIPSSTLHMFATFCCSFEIKYLFAMDCIYGIFSQNCLLIMRTAYRQFADGCRVNSSALARKGANRCQG